MYCIVVLYSEVSKIRTARHNIAIQTKLEFGIRETLDLLKCAKRSTKNYNIKFKSGLG